MQRCMDNFSTTFSSYPDMLGYHQELAQNSRWLQCHVNELRVEPLDKASEAHFRLDYFADGISAAAVEDTVANLGLSMRVNGGLYPLRGTAWKGLLDRAKINGSALSKLPKDELAKTLNRCLQLYRSHALLLIRDEKIAAVHSGDEKDYSVLPIDELLETLNNNLNERFPGNQFERGYSDHSLTGAVWKLPKQKEKLLGTYARTLRMHGETELASNLIPGIQFITSDTGNASAKVSALLMGSKHPIYIGSCISVEHRYQTTVKNFDKQLDQLFAQFGDNLKKLQNLLNITLMYPVNALKRICEQFRLPTKAADEVIVRFEDMYGDATATAHDVFMALQEIPYLLKTANASERKCLDVEESLARVLHLDWSEYDSARSVA